tara:strand:- start:4361 stop:4918 length:558 start_codon:yes stop_codon:yes gene_type:complete
MKLNMGCGQNKLNGYLNIDKHNECEPDLQFDLEKFPWPFKNSEVNEVLFNHSLEHIGADTDVFLNIMKELYRVCNADAKIQINVPHPRHDNFINDPTHVRIITPETFALFSKKNNALWKEMNASNSPLAIYMDVDFETTEINQVLVPEYMNKLNNNEISEEEINRYIAERNNIISEFRIVLKVIK